MKGLLSHLPSVIGLQDLSDSEVTQQLFCHQFEGPFGAEIRLYPVHHWL